MMKIASLTSVSGPYIFARYSAFARKFPEYKLQLLELGQTSVTYPWKHPESMPNYTRVVLSEKAVERQSKLSLWKNIINSLQAIKPDLLVIAGYSNISMLFALLWSTFNRKPAILLSATTEYDFSRSWWKEKIKKILVTRYKAALVGGQAQKRYLLKLGMKPNAIFLGYNVVENQTFNSQNNNSLTNPLTRPFFLTINRFVAKKNLLFLISCYAKYRDLARESAWDLVLCGDGDLRTEIEKKVNALNLQSVVHLTGFLQQEEMLPYFAHAGCFIHASTTEQWGLVVNEAMAAGLPVIVSNRCGCFEDLIIEGVNGFGFDPYDFDQLTKLMITISSDHCDRKKMGQAALKHIQKFSPEYFAQGLAQAVDYAISH